MKRRPWVSTSLALVFWIGVGGSALAQWSNDPTLNLAVADPAGDQVQTKIVARPGGGYYVSWFDNRTSGFDVYLQLLDEQGVEQWAHNGVLVADRSFSSTQDYGLAVDTAGNALLAFRDDRNVGTQITAAKVDSGGTLTWGAGGVQLTATTAFVAAPGIAGTSDGEIVVAWKIDTDVHLQRLDTSGAEVWTSATAIADAMSRDYSLSDLKRSDNGAVIAGLVFQPSGFLGPKHLYAQKISSLGAVQWGTSPTAVFDGGSLQFGNFPDFVSDGSGGAVFSWYNTDGELQCYAQHVDSTGAESFPHNGSAVSTSTLERTEPDVAYDPGSASTYVFWRELQPGGTPQYGIYGQRLNATGARQWGNSGIAVAALSTAEVTSARVVLDGTDAVTFWVRSASPTVQSILASRVDASGGAVWAPAQSSIATSASGKSRLVAEMGPSFAVAGWSDNRSGLDDVFVQNVNTDGTLGASAAGPGDVSGLVVDRSLAPLQLTLTWGASCSAGAVDYAVYEGTLASLGTGVYDHDQIVCSDLTPTLTETIVPLAGDTYYLVVPLGASAEGSYGARRDGAVLTERPTGTTQCVATQALGCP